jgi:metal-responsive CopG/Arc/MetJ family transcriptional regulator
MIANASERSRITLELSASVLSLLDHVCDVTGASRSSIINAALVDALPALLERSDGLHKRAQALTQAQASKKR